MNRVAMLSSIVLLSAVGLLALQDPQGSEPPAPGASESAPQTIRGCLSGSGTAYTLTEHSGRAWQLDASAETLNMMKGHVGHEVAVTGTQSKAGESASSSTAGETTSAGRNTLRVSDVQHVADTCGAGTGAAPGSGHMGSQTPEQPSAIQGSAAGEAAQNDAAAGAPPPVTNQTPSRPAPPTRPDADPSDQPEAGRSR